MKKLLQSLFVLMLLANFAMAQDRTITGTVTGKEDGLPLPGVSVKVKNAKISTITSSNGKFSIQLPSGSNELEVSFIGYLRQSVTVGSRNNISISLVQNVQDLSEVVVTGYQTVKKSDLTSSVATVLNKEIADKPISSFTQLLQGKAAGVQVTAQSGKPGANAFIRMRGTGSISAASDPLIIVDGVPVVTEAFSLLNPNDIDNISFLKDATATAIYGSRGSNGVVVVTSKKGKAGEPTVRYSFTYGIANEQKLRNLELMDGRQKLQYEYETGTYTNPALISLINVGKTAGTLPANATLFNITPDQRQGLWNNLLAQGNDWNDQFMRKNAATKTHEVSIAGGSDKFTYYFSLNKRNEEGVLQQSYRNRTGGRLNVEYQAKDWLKVGTNLGVTHTVENQTRELFNGQALYTASQLLNPYEPAFNPDGSYNYTSLGQNALETAINNPNTLDRLSGFGTVFGEIKAFNHLTLKSQVGLNYNTLSQEYYLKPGSYLAQTLGYSQKRDNGNRDFLYVFTNTASWNQSIGKHSFNALLGTEYTKEKFYSYSLTNQGFPSATVNTLENGSKPTQATTSRRDQALISYFGVAQYDYDKRYFVTLSGRRDGSSKFGKNNRFANFWALGGAWDIKNESFFNVDEVSSLKLRGSIGTSGNNSGITEYMALGTYAYNVNYNALPAASPNVIANPNLTWESNKNSDIGLDFGVFDNRISGSVEYYNRKTKDLLYPQNISLTTGFASFTGNVGAIVNKGFEISLSGDVIRNKDLTWKLFANYSSNKNRITDLYSDNVIAAGTGNIAYLKVGQPVFTYFLANWAGVNPQTGKNEWFDESGNRSDQWKASYAKLQEGKSSQVKYFGSFGTSVNYKQFDLSAQFYYSGGNYIYNITRNVGSSEGESIANNQFTEALDYWKKPGDVKRYANLADPGQQVTYDSDKYLEKGDYISLRDVTLGYTLSPDVAKRIHVKSIRVFVQGTNLWIGTKFHGNPEVGQANSEQSTTTVTAYYQPGIATLYGYPQIKAYTAGINVTF